MFRNVLNKITKWLKLKVLIENIFSGIFNKYIPYTLRNIFKMPRLAKTFDKMSTKCGKNIKKISKRFFRNGSNKQNKEIKNDNDGSAFIEEINEGVEQISSGGEGLTGVVKHVVNNVATSIISPKKNNTLFKLKDGKYTSDNQLDKEKDN